MTPDSFTAHTEKLKSVSQHSETAFGVKLSRSHIRRSPDLVDIDVVGSLGILRTSKTIVKQSFTKLSLLILGIPGRAFWNW